MSLEFKNLNVASLDYRTIVNSIRSFLKQEPTLSDLDFDNEASAVNMLVNILATATAYNGVYSQFGYKESFMTTAELLESIVGLASNSSVLLNVKKSASSTRNIQTGTAGLTAYTPFTATATDGSSILFFNTETVPASTAETITLYCGSGVVQYTNWDFTTNSLVVPLTVDPESITLYTVDNSGNEITWTKVTKYDESSGSDQYVFSVLNTVNGYLVTTNLPEAFQIDTTYTVYVKAITSNGSKGNNSTISNLNGVTFLTTSVPSDGYDSLSASEARAKVQFGLSSMHRCVTLADFEKAIINSGIGDIDESSIITVGNDDVPCTVKIYVDGLSEANSILLMSYLSARAVAGVNLVYKQ